MTNPESAKVLAECAELQMKKARDYQNPELNSATSRLLSKRCTIYP